MEFQPSLGIGAKLPLLVQSPSKVGFSVAADETIWLVLLTGVVILLAGYWWLVNRTGMLRDADSNYYSLGKSQMAFWGMLVFLAFVGVWFLTGTLERIPPQALALLGISGATGLGAVAIGNSKKKDLQTQVEAKRTDLLNLKQEQQTLQQQQTAQPTDFAVDKLVRLGSLPTLIEEAKQTIDKLSTQLAQGASKGFWRDICDGGNGASFHRLQVVAWTLVLGTIFVQSVADTMSMPEYSQTLLTLMGISNATYLGFKIPEKS